MTSLTGPKRTSLLLALALSGGCLTTGKAGSRSAPQEQGARAEADETKASTQASSSASHSAMPQAAESKRSPLPSDQVELLYPRLPHFWLGIELKARPLGHAGVLVERVLAGSPAERAQVRKGDIVMALGEQALNSPQELSDFVRAQTSRAALALTVQRQGQVRLLRVELEQMPEFEDRLRLAFVGRSAPEIAGMITFQGEVSSLKELRGQVIILEFWASFCQVCRIMGPTLDQWHRHYLGRGAQVVGITVDSPKTGLDVARRAQMSYTLGSDPDAEITRKYMASQIPTLFIIDQNGIVRDAIVGYSAERLEAAHVLVDQLLAQGS